MSDDVSSESITLRKEKILTEVSPGTVCRLIGVRRRFGGRHGFGPRRHPPREHRIRRHAHGSFEDDRQCKFRGPGRRRNRETMKRLLDLGITKGCTFEVVQGSEQGPVLVQVRGTRIALGHKLASRIMVEVVGV